MRNVPRESTGYPQARCIVCDVKHDRKRPDGSPKSYCLSCHASWMRAHRPKHRDMPPEARRRANARSYANVYQRRGKLVPQPCACGATETEKHHTDYSQPLKVRWLCRPCHLQQHRDH